MDTQQQRELFSRAVDAIGGIGTAARALDINPRNVTRLLTGDRRLHTGHLQKISEALLSHAALCRDLERQLSPAYSANLTEAQARPPHHDGDRPSHPRGKPTREQVAAAAIKLGLRSPPSPIGTVPAGTALHRVVIDPDGKLDLDASTRPED